MWAGVRPQGVDVGVFGVVKPSDSPIVAVFPAVKPSESPPAQVFLVVKPSESPSVLVFGAVKPSESPPFYVFLVVKPSESPPFYVFHPVIPSVSPILTCGFVLCACLRRWPLPGGVWLGWGRSGAVLRRSCVCWRRLRLSTAAWLSGCARLWAGVGPVDVGVVVVGGLVSWVLVVGVVGWGGEFVVASRWGWCWAVGVSWLFDERVYGCLSLNGLWVVVCAFTWACWYIGMGGVVW